MKAPFDYGKVITIDFFTNRTKEIKRLEQNFVNGVNTILISPRRWGKSSLVKNTAEKLVLKNKKFKVVFIDLFNVLNEEEFYNEIAYETIKCTATKFEGWVENSIKFLSKFKPSIGLSNDPSVAFDLQLSLTETRKNFKDILDLPEKIAIEKNIHLIVCIDEFQNVEKFSSDAVALQKKMRAQWQHHHHVTYCLYGSKRHLMMALFEKQSMPFFKFGDTFYLEKIKEEHWLPYIQKQFLQTHKSISEELCSQIVRLMQEHPYYVQQLCQLVWLNTNKKVTADILATSIADLMDRNNALFQRDFEMLTSTQVNYLRAMLHGETAFSSKEVLQRYNMGTSANIQRVVKALEDKEIINKLGKTIEFADPAFALFLKSIYHIA